LLLLKRNSASKNAKQRNVKKENRPPLPPHKRFDLGCALVFAGLSSKGNRYVTFKLAGADDIWFHAQGVPGAHVILRFTSIPTEEKKRRPSNFVPTLPPNTAGTAITPAKV
jgi:Predicted RNA-binding protein homologous to eukaryotic snRNP